MYQSVQKWQTKRHLFVQYQSESFVCINLIYFWAKWHIKVSVLKNNIRKMNKHLTNKRSCNIKKS